MCQAGVPTSSFCLPQSNGEGHKMSLWSSVHMNKVKPRAGDSWESSSPSSWMSLILLACSEAGTDFTPSIYLLNTGSQYTS